MRSDDVSRMSSARWVRRGREIILLGDAGVPAGALDGEAVFRSVGRTRVPAAPPTLTPCDFIHKDVDVAAQYALHQLFREGGAAADAAMQMLSAVRAGRLGIYQEDQQVPALRAKGLPTVQGWWNLVNRLGGGRDAACVTVPRGAVPLLVFRKSIANDRARLGRELRAAFARCGVGRMPLPVPTGRPCIRPAPRRVPDDGPPPGTPELCIDPGELVFRVRENGLPQTQVLRVGMCSGGGQLTWTARTSSDPWLSVSPSAGWSGGSIQNVAVTVDPRAMRAPMRRATITFHSPEAMNFQQTVGIILEWI